MATGTIERYATLSGTDRQGNAMSAKYNISESWDDVENKSVCKITSIVFTYYTSASNAYAKTTGGKGGSIGHDDWSGASAFSVSNGNTYYVSESISDQSSVWTIPFGGSDSASLTKTTSGTASTYQSSEFTVYHASDGSASITIGGYWSWGTVNSTASYPRDTRGGIHGGSSGTQATATITLKNTAPKISSISVGASSYEAGANVSYTITNTSAPTYTNNVEYSFDNLTWASIGSGGTGLTPGTYSWSTSSLGITSEKTCYIRCTTYNGSESVGTSNTASFRFTVSVAPTISSVVLNHISDSAVVTTWGVYVQGYSKVRVTANYSLATGASIGSCRITVNDSEITNTSCTYNQTIATSGVITSSGTITIGITVTDGNDRSASTTSTITVYPYAKPYASSASALRYSDDVDVEDLDDGTNISAKATIISSGVNGNNTAIVAARFRAASGSYTTNPTTISSGASSHQDITSYGPTVSTESSYVVQFLIYDSLHPYSSSNPTANDPTIVEIVIPTKSVVIACRDGGDAIAFGGFPSKGSSITRYAQVADGWKFYLPSADDVYCNQNGTDTSLATLIAGGGTISSYIASAVVSNSGNTLTLNYGDGTTTTVFTPSGGGGGTSNVFIATYNTTTYSEITTAYLAGKDIVLKDSTTRSDTVFGHIQSVSVDDSDSSNVTYSYKFCSEYLTYAYSVPIVSRYSYTISSSSSWAYTYDVFPEVLFVNYSISGVAVYNKIASSISNSIPVMALGGTGKGNKVYMYAGLLNGEYRFENISNGAVDYIKINSSGEWSESAFYFPSTRSLAAEYDTTLTYFAGDYASRGSTLYKCTGSTTGTWDSTKWSSITVMGEIGNIETILEALL